MNVLKYTLRKIISEYRLIKKYHWGSWWNYKHGFLPATISVCGIDKKNYKHFLSDADYIKGHPYNGVYSSIIDNKLYLPMLLHEYSQNLPKYYFYKDKFGFLSLSKDFSRNERWGNDVFFTLLRREKLLCAKHTHSSTGQGFMLIRYCEDTDTYFLNEKVIALECLDKKVSMLDEYIITEYIHQHSYAADICATSLNTIRFLCAWDFEKREFFVARCFHRFGCNGNIVDNVGSGNGILVFVDTETGVMKSYGAINVNNVGDRYAENIIHPDKNILLTGIKIPNFQKIKEDLLKIANSISFLRWVGFDVAVTEDGFKIIEINSLSSLVDQGREGYLDDQRIKKVLKK